MDQLGRVRLGEPAPAVAARLGIPHRFKQGASWPHRGLVVTLRHGRVDGIVLTGHDVRLDGVDLPAHANVLPSLGWRRCGHGTFGRVTRGTEATAVAVAADLMVTLTRRQSARDRCPYAITASSKSSNTFTITKAKHPPEPPASGTTW
jgi:hypothetical protein